MSKIVYSYSSLAAHERCPTYFQARYIDKSVPFESHPALERGNAVHEALEKCVDSGAEVPADVWVPGGLVPLLREAGARAEVKYGMTAAGVACDFWADDVLFRGAVDVELRQGSSALLLDWKTGKVRPDDLQADSYATLLRAGAPDLEVTFVWVYVDAQTTRSYEAGPDAKDRIMRAITFAEEDSRYIPRPSWFCRFCPVTTCSYNRRNKDA